MWWVTDLWPSDGCIIGQIRHDRTDTSRERLDHARCPSAHTAIRCPAGQCNAMFREGRFERGAEPGTGDQRQDRRHVRADDGTPVRTRAGVLRVSAPVKSPSMNGPSRRVAIPAPGWRTISGWTKTRWRHPTRPWSNAALTFVPGMIVLWRPRIRHGRFFRHGRFWGWAPRDRFSSEDRM